MRRPGDDGRVAAALWALTGVFALRVLDLVSMFVRHAVRMALQPDARWLGGTIPIFFHLVLASFIIVFARHHSSEARG